MQKKIPFHKIDRAVRYKKSEIEEWVEKGNCGADKQVELLSEGNK